MKTQIDDGEEFDALRCFVAVLLEPSVLDELLVVQRLLRKRLVEGVRWTKPEQMHLTLHFLGEVEGTRVEDLSASLEKAVTELSPFDLRLEGVGVFPERGRPRVIWVGLAGDLEGLTSLQQAVAQAVGAWGDHRETKAFRPHLTLGRVRPESGLGEEVNGLLRGGGGPRSISWTVREVALMSSDLALTGARYTVVSTAGLG